MNKAISIHALPHTMSDLYILRQLVVVPPYDFNPSRPPAASDNILYPALCLLFSMETVIR